MSIRSIITSLPLSDADREVLVNAPAGGIVDLPPATLLNALNWQPMDTAPKDGTRILLWVEDGWGVGVSEGYWGDGAWRLSVRDNGYCGLCCGEPHEPTAWAPAPAGPSWGDAS